MAVELSTWDAQGNQTTPTFSTMRFPAGEAHVKVANDTAEPGDLTEIATLRGTNGDDLIMLGMWADAVRQRGSKSVALVPYLPGARQDRGLPFGAKVYADVLNGFHLDQVIAFDPHSPVIVGLVDNLIVVTSEQVVRDAVVSAPEHDSGDPYTGIIAPDKGAVPRATAVAEACGLPLYRAEKHRNPDTGKLDGFTCEPCPTPDGSWWSTTSATAAARSWASPARRVCPRNASASGSRTASSPVGPHSLPTTSARSSPPTRTPRRTPSTACARSHSPLPDGADPMTQTTSTTTSTSTGIEPRITTASPIAPCWPSTATSTRTGRSTRQAPPAS